jgi:hypothetical protein
MRGKQGFFILELVISMALASATTLLAFGAGVQFFKLFRETEKKTQSLCMMYTALQVLRSDIEGASAEKKHWNINSSHDFKLLGSNIHWIFDKQRRELVRTRSIERSGHLVHDRALILQNAEKFEIKSLETGSDIIGATVLLAHNGRQVNTKIFVRNKKHEKK